MILLPDIYLSECTTVFVTFLCSYLYSFFYTEVIVTGTQCISSLNPAAHSIAKRYKKEDGNLALFLFINCSHRSELSRI